MENNRITTNHLTGCFVKGGVPGSHVDMKLIWGKKKGKIIIGIAKIKRAP